MSALLMGDRYKQAREYRVALDYYRQALAVEKISRAIKASAFNAIATVYAELYVDDLAESYFTNALDEAKAARVAAAEALALRGLADLSLRQGATQKALDFVTLALKAHAAADPALSYLLGRVRQEQRAMPQAQAAFEAALATYEKARDPVGQVRVLCALSDLALLVSQKQAALEHAQRATELAGQQYTPSVTGADHLNGYDLCWPAWLSRARAERALGLTDRAVISYRTAVHCIGGLYWGVYIITEASAMAFREVTHPVYREWVDLLIQQGRLADAFRTVEQAKARVALNLITVRQQARQSSGGRLLALQREPSPSISQLRLRLATPGLSRERQARLKIEMADAELKARESQLEAEMRSAPERLIYPRVFDTDRLKEQTANNHLALAEFSLGETQSFVWLFTDGEVFFGKLPARREIEDQVRAYLSAISETPNPLRIERDIARLRKQAAALFALLFGHLSEKIEPGRRLVVVPDGLLHYLPFEALVHNERYLVEDHEISYDSSASMLGLWGDDDRAHQDMQRELFAVGDPVYEWQAADGAAVGLSPLARQMLKARGLSLAALPRTRDEVRDIAALFPAGQCTVLLGKESTEEAIKREPLSRYRRLHFAAHSLINEKAPLRSAVILTPGGAQDDGMLEASEIARLNLDSDLVVVSACQTGRGQLLSGEGIVGISRAFLEAGSRAVVVSLWNVNDIVTSRLMKDFYQQLTNGMGNAAALRGAKLRMLKGRQTRHPYYWATFVMVGKP